MHGTNDCEQLRHTEKEALLKATLFLGLQRRLRGASNMVAKVLNSP
jgi:hypothetical protein